MENNLEEMLLSEDDEILRGIGTTLKKLNELEIQIDERSEENGGE